MPMGQMQKTIRLNVTMSEDLWPYSVINEIQKVMEEGLRKYPKGEGWKESALEHVEHAIKHIRDFKEGGLHIEEHLAHAFTRLMMAVAIEKGYVDDKEDMDA